MKAKDLAEYLLLHPESEVKIYDSLNGWVSINYASSTLKEVCIVPFRGTSVWSRKEENESLKSNQGNAF